DPGLRPLMWDYPINQRDEIRRIYITELGPYQHILSDYPYSGPETHLCLFQASWFKLFTWLEYSPSKDAAYCFPCYLFTNKTSERLRANAFVVEGFTWRKVNSGKDCAFLTHVRKSPSSPHNVAIKCCEDLKIQFRHIDTIIDKQTVQEIVNNRLQLKTSVDAIRWLAFQACSFRCHDEHHDSQNQGNFLELLKMLASHNEKVNEVVLNNAPKNAKYTSPPIQKDILHVISSNVRSVIRDEIGDAKFCLLVDEARDESKREQMSLVLRFVNKEGFVLERFFDLLHVKDTSASTLKEEIFATFSYHNLNIQNIRGQGYDGASNMRGEWNGLQALILNDCPYAYYVHCLAHRLQLALVSASREVISVHHFFLNLAFIINIVGASCKRNDELHAAQVAEIELLISIDELDTGSGVNHIGTLQRAGDTRWSSHFCSVSSLLRLYNPTCTVLGKIVEDGSTYSQRGEACVAYDLLTSFEFVFILYLLKEIMEITDILYQALQQKSQDIMNAMHLVAGTKTLIQNLRENGWKNSLKQQENFTKHDIEILEMSAQFTMIRSRCQQAHVTVEHHFQVDVFIATIDSQLQELNIRFNEHAVELIILSSALTPNDDYRSFDCDKICNLVEKFYPLDFTEQEKILLKCQLQYYQFDVINHPDMQNLCTIAWLCRKLVETGKSEIYYLIDRLLRLVLTLPVSTATTERAFSAMKIIKTRLRSKMEDDFLTNCLVVYIEQAIAEKISVDKIIDDFYDMKKQRAQL
ncbi:LOW QUALITY PROTEIN: Dimer_Tnp_hAT domain-containing protein/DUF4371 domain-containing protein, partial [Cephalotus follicularis]